MSDGSVTLIEVQLQRTDADEAELVIDFPGVTVRQPVSIDNDNEFHTIVLKLEGKFLSIYVDCRFESFLKLESSPENITVTDDTRLTLFDSGYTVYRKLSLIICILYTLDLSAGIKSFHSRQNHYLLLLIRYMQQRFLTTGMQSRHCAQTFFQ